MSMIEMVARALFNGSEAEWLALPLIQQLVFRSSARKAILAMRDASEAMVEAGYDADPEGGHYDGGVVWTAMIDAAIGEG